MTLEPGFAPGTEDALTEAGFDVRPPIGTHWYGVGHVIRIHADGWLEGGSDPRHDGVAVGLLAGKET